MKPLFFVWNQEEKEKVRAKGEVHAIQMPTEGLIPRTNKFYEIS